ncbi:hypothetical protein E2C01_095267 [Portunus trituberculatus]|uniref:Uncharacterized protein n=1 Tax=Portunus trituberculatus TaxID=210409 RepID=A0A5B7K395_PORTR|nr:hypothetical protein [Portunus trituberculatus]
MSEERLSQQRFVLKEGSGEWRDSSLILAGTEGRTTSRRVFWSQQHLVFRKERVAEERLSQQCFVLKKEWMAEERLSQQRFVLKEEWVVEEISKAGASFYNSCSTPISSSTSQSQLEYPPGHRTFYFLLFCVYGGSLARASGCSVVRQPFPFSVPAISLCLAKNASTEPVFSRERYVRSWVLAQG